jgi:rhodanese-related sulfurtransferase
LKLPSDPLKALTFAAAALVCAGLANRWAGPTRKLDWTGWAPPPAAAPAAAPPLAVPQPQPLPLPPPVRQQAPAPMGKVAMLPARPAAPAPQAAVPADPAAPFAAEPSQVLREISSDAALAAFRLRIPFLDARRSEDFAAGHLPGAWSVPIWEADAPARITEFEARANPEPRSPIVIYCSGGDCEDSRLLANKLVGLGYRNLLIYTGGFPDWARQGRPQEKGARP